jgi:4-amino-4-deoxy-L-arabinose transferase-like glycosyltransferase
MREKVSQYLSNRDFFLLCSLVFLSFLIRALSLHFFHFIASGGGSADSIVYAITGKNLFSGKGFSYQGTVQLVHPPLYPILIGFFWLLTNNLEFSGQAVSAIAGSLLVIPVYYFAKAIYGRRVGLLSAIFVVICPILVYGSTETFSESLYTLFLISSVALTWKALSSRNLVWISFAGLTAGLSFLTHPLGILFVPIFLVFLFLSLFLIPAITLRSVFKKATLLLLSFIIVCLPYWVFLHKHLGRWSLSANSNYVNVYWYKLRSQGTSQEEIAFKAGNSQIASDMIASDPRLSDSSVGIFGYYFSHPGELPERFMRNLKDAFLEIDKIAQLLRISPFALKAILAMVGLFFLLGLVKMLREKKLTVKELYIAFPFLSLSIFLLFRFEHRYFYPYVPLLLIIIAKIAVEFESWLEKKISPRNRVGGSVSGFLLTGILIVVMGSSSIYLIPKKNDLVPHEYKIMGQWMKDNINHIENKLVMSRKLAVPFYAEARHQPFYYGDYPGLIEYAKSRKVDYLLIDDWIIPKARPQFAFLLEENENHPGLRLVHIVRHKGRRAILYKIE